MNTATQPDDAGMQAPEAASVRWGLCVSALLGQQTAIAHVRPGRVCHGTYRDQAAPGVLQQQLEAAAAVRRGWKQLGPERSEPGRTQR